MVDKIYEAADQVYVRRVGGYRRYVLACTEPFHRGKPLIQWNTVSGTVPAYIVGGMWAVKCPLHLQDSILFAQPGEPFFCPLCLMERNGGRPMVVEFPEDRATIEAILLLRPNPANRNWLPGETLADLVLENVVHGIQPTPPSIEEVLV